MFLTIFFIVAGQILVSCKKPSPMTDIKPTTFKDSDHLVFAQSWPPAVCKEWKGRNSRNTCDYPDNRKIWTIHGLWPSKTGYRGPYYCREMKFNLMELRTKMRKDLEQYWTNVQANKKYGCFWEHEWLKHGTCALEVPQLGDVHKYFGKSIELNKKSNLNIYNILHRAQVIPGTSYNFSVVYEIVKSSINNKKPCIQCLADRRTQKKIYLSEIRICLSKTFAIIDCPEPKNDCDIQQPIQYLLPPEYYNKA